MAPAASAAPLPPTCHQVGTIQDIGLCERECSGTEGDASTEVNFLLVYYGGFAPCDGSEGLTYGYVLAVSAWFVFATGDYGDGRQTAVLVGSGAGALLVDWHEYDGQCTTTVGYYEPHGYPYYEQGIECPLGSAPTSPNPGYGSILP